MRRSLLYFYQVKDINSVNSHTIIRRFSKERAKRIAAQNAAKSARKALDKAKKVIKQKRKKK